MEYVRGPQRSGVNAAAVAAVSEAGAKFWSFPIPLNDVIVTAVSTVGNERVVLRHGSTRMMLKGISTGVTAG